MIEKLAFLSQKPFIQSFKPFISIRYVTAIRWQIEKNVSFPQLLQHEIFQCLSVWQLEHIG